MTPSDTLQLLKVSANKRTQDSLDLIFTICSEIVDSCSPDLTIANVSALGRLRGCPSAQSIRNKTGQHYRILINSFSEHAKSIGLTRVTNKPDSWIEDIDNPRIRILVRTQEAELKKLHSLLREIIPPETEIIVHEGRIGSSKESLSEIERRALSHIISDDFFTLWKFTRGERGDILDQNGQRIFPVGTIDAIEKALRNL